MACCSRIRALRVHSGLGGLRIPSSTFRAMVYPGTETPAFGKLRQLEWRARDFDGLEFLLVPTVRELIANLSGSVHNTPLHPMLHTQPVAAELHTLGLPWSITGAEVIVIMEACPRLHTLRLPWYMMSQPQVLAKVFHSPTLEELGCDHEAKDGYFLIVARFSTRAGRSLESLELLGPWVELAQWVLGLPEQLPDAGLASLTVQFECTLRKVDIAEGFHELMAVVTSRYRSSLRHFKLEQVDDNEECWIECFHEILVPLIGLPWLRSLVIDVRHTCEVRLNDDQIEAALPHWNGLEIFILRLGSTRMAMTSVTGFALCHFAKFCPWLQELEIPLMVLEGPGVTLPHSIIRPATTAALKTLRIVPMLPAVTGGSERLRLPPMSVGDNVAEAMHIRAVVGLLFEDLAVIEYRREGNEFSWNLALRGVGECIGRQRLAGEGLWTQPEHQIGENSVFSMVEGMRKDSHALLAVSRA